MPTLEIADEDKDIIWRVWISGEVFTYAGYADETGEWQIMAFGGHNNTPPFAEKMTRVSRWCVVDGSGALYHMPTWLKVAH